MKQFVFLVVVALIGVLALATVAHGLFAGPRTYGVSHDTSDTTPGPEGVKYYDLLLIEAGGAGLCVTLGKTKGQFVITGHGAHCSGEPTKQDWGAAWDVVRENFR